MSFLPTTRDWVAARPKDLLAGLTVAVVALPLALGFGVTSGLGAAAGSTTGTPGGRLSTYRGADWTAVHAGPASPRTWLSGAR